MPKWKVIKAKVPTMEAMIKPFDKEMDHVVDLVEKSFNSTVSTWDNKPKFERSTKRFGGVGFIEIFGSISTEDDIYRYLNNGTGVRYATMTPDFVAKTKPGRISAKSGRGGVAFVRRDRPKPGIKARKWDVLIANGKKSAVERAFKRAVIKSIKASGHKI